MSDCSNYDMLFHGQIKIS